METDLIKKNLFKTFDVLKVKEVPALIEEILHFYINTPDTPQVPNNLIAEKLRELEKDGLIFINEEGFVGFSHNISDAVKKRLHLEEVTKDQAKYSSKVLKTLKRFKFIRFVGIVGDAPLGRMEKDKKIKLILVVEKETAHLARFVTEGVLRFKFALKNFRIDKIVEIDTLRWENPNPENGIKLLNLLPLINSDKVYEGFMAANNWIFEIFSNYPLEKVSWGFRISKNLGREVSGFHRKLNDFLKPKN